MAQVALGDMVTATDALCDVVAGEFDVDAAGVDVKRPQAFTVSTSGGSAWRIRLSASSFT